jgi:hypothetical protein
MALRVTALLTALIPEASGAPQAGKQRAGTSPARPGRRHKETSIPFQPRSP